MSQQPVSNRAGVLYVVATPIGNLGDLSPRAVEVLRAVDWIAAEDTRHSGRLLRHFGIGRPLLSLHEHNESKALEKVVGHLEAGRSVALISDAGTPLVSDPGFPLVRECRRRGLRVSPVPGPSALVAALSACGLPADHFCFHGFPPRQPAARRERLGELRSQRVTLVFYESSHRIAASLADMAEVLGGDRPACVARELTKRHEEFLHGSLEELARLVADDPDRQRGEFVVVVGAAPKVAGSPAALERDELLRILLEELPLKQAVAIAARLTGGKKNELYQRALAMKK